MKLIFVVLTLVSFQCFAEGAATTQAPQKPTKGSFTCGIAYDNHVTFAENINKTCDLGKQISTSQTAKSNGSIQMMFCCISK